MKNKLFHYRVFYNDNDSNCPGMAKKIDLYFGEEHDLKWIEDYWFKFWAKPTENSIQWDFITCYYEEIDSKGFSKWNVLK